MLDTAMRLNPVIPSSYSEDLGEILYMKGDYADAIAAFERALEISPLHMRARMWLAATLSHIGQIEDAQWQVNELTMLSPDFLLHVWSTPFRFVICEFGIDYCMIYTRQEYTSKDCRQTHRS